MVKSGKLTPRQRRAIEALIAGQTVRGAALAAGVGYRTLRRWLRQEPFQEALIEAQGVVLQDLQARLAALSLQAVAAFEHCLAPHVDPRYRLKAAEVVLAHLLRVRELVDLERRVAALEERLSGHEPEN